MAVPEFFNGIAILTLRPSVIKPEIWANITILHISIPGKKYKQAGTPLDESNHFKLDYAVQFFLSL